MFYFPQNVSVISNLETSLKWRKFDEVRSLFTLHSPLQLKALPSDELVLTDEAKGEISDLPNYFTSGWLTP